MPDKFVERYGPVTDVGRQSLPRPLSRPVKRRTSADDDGQKKKSECHRLLCAAVLEWKVDVIASHKGFSYHSRTPNAREADVKQVNKRLLQATLVTWSSQESV